MDSGNMIGELDMRMLKNIIHLIQKVMKEDLQK